MPRPKKKGIPQSPEAPVATDERVETIEASPREEQPVEVKTKTGGTEEHLLAGHQSAKATGRPKNREPVREWNHEMQAVEMQRIQPPMETKADRWDALRQASLAQGVVLPESPPGDWE